MGRLLFGGSCLAVLLGLMLAQGRPGAGGQPERRGTQVLGARCTADRDCATGLECVDIEGLLDAQCTAGCSSTDSCRLRFGTQALCIGADVCVHTCEADGDCPLGTFCNPYAWCETR
jgi:hypothetical protein